MDEEQTEKSAAKSLTELIALHNEAVEAFSQAADAVDEATNYPDNYDDAELKKRQDEFSAAVVQAERIKGQIDSAETRQRIRNQYTLIKTNAPGIAVKEPDMYVKDGRPFLTDLYAAQIKGDGAASARINKHQQHELEKFAITSATFGGIIPPAYLIDLYAKASRNGRVFADQVNNAPLPDVGMSVIVPRLTQGLAAAAQTTQNTAVVTQDITEADLSVAVNTISGYSPVSRQGLERAAYSDQILFEDLIARYWAILDTYCLNGSGSNNQPQGLLGTGSISSSTASTATVAGVWPKIADVIQQINTSVGGLGYNASKIFMHPRRWGFFEAALDSQNRPLIVPSGAGFNVMGLDGNNTPDYGLVGNMHGLPVFTDANIPTNTGATTNQDSIIVIADRVVHLFVRASDPVTLSFEQTGATNLTVNLIAYGYIAFTAGRYPGASGAVTGQGLVPPTF
jgi:HK97 family phage major capsid protein